MRISVPARPIHAEARPIHAAARRASAPRPFWVGRRPSPARARAVPATAPVPSGLRWWAGVAWLLLSAILLGFIAHVTVLGALQHARGQESAYQELRAGLAKAVTPLGQLDVDGVPVVPGTPVALLSIPAIGLNEVVVEGTAGDQVRLGPGHRRDTVLPGQAGTSVLHARQSSYGGPFRSLAALKPGDQLTVTTGQGVTRFEVFGVRRSGDLLPLPLGKGEARLELVTGEGLALAPSGTLHVDATLVGTVKETPSRVFTSAMLSASEGAMAADPDAWFPTLFWAQWLLAATIAVRWLAGAWGRPQAWTVGVPTLLALGAATADSAIAMFPNLV